MTRPTPSTTTTATPTSGPSTQLAAVGLVAGTGPRQYSPSAPVTRAQLASYLVKVYERLWRAELPAALDRFADDRHSIHESSIDRAASLRTVSGVSAAQYAPDSPVRRDQMARFLATASGCTHAWLRDGQRYHENCDAYPDTEGPHALQGFEIALTTAQRHYTLGQPVELRIEACNRRDTALEQVFPQRDWFVLEARHDRLPAQEHWTERTWYDHRYQPSLNGSGYGERDMDAIHSRISDRHPRTTALTWYDGPQVGPHDVVCGSPASAGSSTSEPGSRPTGRGSRWDATTTPRTGGTARRRPKRARRPVSTPCT